MRKVMLVGECGSGRSAIIRALSGGGYTPRRALAVEYHGQFIHPPGEFLENRRFYPALITSSADCELVALVQDATRNSSLFPPKFAFAFNRPALGIISKSDASGADLRRAERFLANAGITEIISISTESGLGLELLQSRFS